MWFSGSWFLTTCSIQTITCMVSWIRPGFVGIILMDLPKSYDHLPNNVLITKSEAYSINKNELHLTHKYLLSRKQRKNVIFSDTDWYIKV